MKFFFCTIEFILQTMLYLIWFKSSTKTSLTRRVIQKCEWNMVCMTLLHEVLLLVYF